MLGCSCLADVDCAIHPDNDFPEPGHLIDETLFGLVLVYLRRPADANTVDGEPVFTFTPPLSDPEQATYSDILSRWRANLRHLTTLATIRPHLVTIRDHRQMGRNAFMALTATERDRLTYDVQAATTTILLAVLRD
jgi:hypothetical protein